MNENDTGAHVAMQHGNSNASTCVLVCTCDATERGPPTLGMCVRVCLRACVHVLGEVS